MFSVNKKCEDEKKFVESFFFKLNVLFILLETITIIGRLIRTIVIRRKMVIYI